MKFDLNLFKKALETDVLELHNLSLEINEMISLFNENYLIEAFDKQLKESSEKFKHGKSYQDACTTLNTQIMVKFAYMQGFKDGKENNDK